jgi:hypothetical protein
MIPMDTIETPKRSCLACGHEVGIFRRLARQRFCSDEHEQMYFTQLQELAIERLKSSLDVSLDLGPSLDPCRTKAVIEENDASAPNRPFVWAHQTTGAA